MGEGNVFSLFTPGGGGGVRSSWQGGIRSSCRGGGSDPAAGGGGGGQVQLPGGSGPAGGGGSGPAARGGSGPAAGGGSVWRGGGQSGGVSILCPLAGGMPLAFTQEDFLVLRECLYVIRMQKTKIINSVTISAKFQSRIPFLTQIWYF